jgi:hypothetical protein
MGFGVRRETVFAAFRAKKIDYVPLEDSPDTKYLVEVAAPNGAMATEYIPPELGRREPQRLATLYGIPIQWLYSPLMIPGEEEGRPPS